MTSSRIHQFALDLSQGIGLIAPINFTHARDSFRS